MSDGLLLHPFMLRLLRRIAGDTAAAKVIARHAPASAALFDRGWYEAAYPDVRGRDPLVHYMTFGAAEGRSPHPLFDSSYYARQHPEARGNPLIHYVTEGAAKRYATHPDRGFCLIPPPDRPLRVLTLLVRHGTEKYPGACDRLDDLMSRILPDVQRRIVIIDNALAPETCTEEQGRKLIGGDNTFWEFSGWDRGLQFAGELDRFDCIHFATDAYEQFDAAFPAQFGVPALQSLRFGHAAAGHIDFLNEPAELFGRPVQSWIRSSFFFLLPATVTALGSMVSIRDKSLLFTGDPARPFRADSPVSGKMAGYVSEWLTGEGLGQGVQWHSRFELSESTLPFFEAKATSVLNELMLSERLRALGCWIADITWLRRVLDGAAPGRLFEEHWRDQVSNRPSQ